MINLLKETEKLLAIHHKTLDDIRWIGGCDFEITKEEFIKAANISYDNGYDAQKVATDLIIVGDDWWLERYEYDGSECWEFKTIPTRPADILRNKIRLTVPDDRIGWCTLKECNMEVSDEN